MTGVAHARIDLEGRLIDADPRLRALQERAGGRIGSPLALPALAAIVRLSRRLGVVVSRAAIVHDAGEEIELWARARPDAGGVSLSVTGWLPRDAAATDRAVDVARAGAAWTLELDAALRITRIGMPGAGDMVGEPLTMLMQLAEDGRGAMPILSALGRRMPFQDQRAALRSTGAAVILSGQPDVDAAGALIGYRCAVDSVPRAGAAAPTTDALGRAFRGPLDRILAGAEGMSLERGSSYADYADDIAGAARHLLALVDDLVDLEAVERPGFTVAGEPIDLALLGRRAAGLLAVRAAERGVRIDPPAGTEALPAMGEPRRVLQILVNLVGNAVRHSPDGGMVWLRGEVARGQATIVVADQGVGIAPEDQNRIFDKFERIEPADQVGSGLGLYIARRLARAMGGDVAVDSAPGQGARFLLTLPVGAG